MTERQRGRKLLSRLILTTIEESIKYGDLTMDDAIDVLDHSKNKLLADAMALRFPHAIRTWTEGKETS